VQISHYRNTFTDSLRSGRGSFGIRGVHFGNHWSTGTGHQQTSHKQKV